MDRIYLIGAGLSSLVIVAGLAWQGGKWYEQSSLNAKIQKKQIAIYEGGRKVDDEVFAANRSALCDLLGGC